MKAAEICDTAAKLVSGNRNKQNGDARKNHGNIAALWNAYLSVRRDPSSPLTANDIATMMVLLKVARMELGAHNPDDAVDAVGYTSLRGQMDAEDAA